MAPTITLISGANRGIGKELLQRYLAKPDHLVIAANRNPDHPSSKALFDLPTGSGSRLVVVKVEGTKQSDPFDAVKELIASGIDHLDVVIANAGISNKWPKVSELDVADLQAHIDINVYGTVWLYQATLPLLLKAKAPKLAGQLPIPNAAYGTSKSAAHWLIKRIDAEEPSLASFVINPGWVATDLGKLGAEALGVTALPDDLNEVCDGVVEIVDQATKESHGGKMWHFSGKQEHW